MEGGVIVFLMMVLTVIALVMAKSAYDKKRFKLTGILLGIAAILVIGLYCEREKESEGALANEGILAIGTSWEVLAQTNTQAPYSVIVKNLQTKKERSLKTRTDLPNKFTAQWDGAWVGRKKVYVPWKEK